MKLLRTLKFNLTHKIIDCEETIFSNYYFIQSLDDKENIRVKRKKKKRNILLNYIFTIRYYHGTKTLYSSKGDFDFAKLNEK